MILVYIIGWILLGTVDSVSHKHAKLIRYAEREIGIICATSNASMCATFCIEIDPSEKVVFFFPLLEGNCKDSISISHSLREQKYTGNTINDTDYYIEINKKLVIFYLYRYNNLISLTYNPDVDYLSAFNLQTKLEEMENRLQKVKDIRATPVGIIPNALDYAKKGASYLSETSARIIPQGRVIEMVSSVAGHLRGLIPQQLTTSNSINSEEGELEFLLMDLLDDYTIREWGRYQFKLEKVFVWKAAYEAWLEVDEIVKSLVEKLQEGDEKDRIPKFSIQVGTRKKTLRLNEVDVMQKGDFEIVPFIFKSVYLSSEVKDENPKDIMFIVANTPSAISFANMRSACSTVCHKYYFTVTSNLIFCCDPNDVKNRRLERSDRMLAMPRKKTGFPPIALRLSANGEPGFVWDQADEMERTLVNHHFCAHKLEPAAEVVVIETEEVGSASCELQIKISKEGVAKGAFKYGVIVNVPKIHSELSMVTKLFLLDKLSDRFRKSKTQTEDSEICVFTDKVAAPKRWRPWRRHNTPVKSASPTLTCVVARKKDKKKREEKEEDYALFMQLYVHFVDTNGWEVYQYTLHSVAAKRAGSLSEARLADDSFDWIYDCGGEEINYERTFSKAAMNSFFRATGMEHRIETLWSKGYLKLVRLVPVYDLMFEGFEGVTNRCAVTPIWNSLWKTWIKLEHTIRQISVKLNTNVKVFVGVYKSLSFEEDGKRKFLRLPRFKPRPQTTDHLDTGVAASTDVTTTAEGTEMKDGVTAANDETVPTETIDGAVKPDDVAAINTIANEASPVLDVKDAATFPDDDAGNEVTSVPTLPPAAAAAATATAAKDDDDVAPPNDTLLTMANRVEPDDTISLSDSEVDMPEMLAAVQEQDTEPAAAATIAASQAKETSESVVEKAGGSSAAAAASQKKEPVKTIDVPGTIWKAVETDKGSLLFIFVNDIFGTGLARTFRKSCLKKCSEYGLDELADEDAASVVLCCPVSVLKELEYKSTIGQMGKWEQELNVKVDEEGVASEVKTDSKEIIVE